MTDPNSSPDDLDELVSSVLDDEADDATRARVENDPDLRGRLEEMRAVRALVAAPVTPLDDLTATRMRRTAIDAALGPIAPSAPTHRGSQVGRWVLSAAAVVLLLVLAIPVLGSLGGNDRSDEQAGETLSSDEEAEDGGTDAASAEMAGERLTQSAQSDADDMDDMAAELETTEDLGDFGSDGSLAIAAIAVVDPASGVATATPADDAPEEGAGAESLSEAQPPSIPDRCPTEEGARVAVLLGTVEGAARIVHVWIVDDEPVARVLHPTTCEVLATR